MIVGKITELDEPVLEDICLKISDKWQEIPTVLDTGFNGMFAMPAKYEADVSLEFLCHTELRLPDGTIELVKVYTGTILIDNLPHITEIVLTDSDTAVIGLQLVRSLAMTVEIKHGKIRLVP